MKILVFAEGTIIMHRRGIGHTREEVIRQVKEFGGIGHLPDDITVLMEY